MTLNVLTIGGSRNIGYFSSIKLLATGANVTFVLRNVSIFDNDKVIQEYVKKGQAHLIAGDALVLQDMRNAWEGAATVAPIDVVIFTVGGIPKLSLIHGAIITPANLVTQSFINLLCVMPVTEPQPKIITLSAAGLTKPSHAALPLPLKPLYSYLLPAPHRDKIGMERVVAHCAGWEWDPKKDGELAEEILPGNWTETEGLPAPGTLKHILVLRPSLLTDGESVAEKAAKKTNVSKPPYRVSEGDIGGWTVSRKDVAHFLVDAVLSRWEEFEGKRITITY